MERRPRQRSLTTLLFGWLLFLLPLLYWVFQVQRSTGGAFVYPLDDTYIHMEIARNLAFEGTWGLNGGEFSSASSSILYTLLLAFSFLVFGVQWWIPLAINIMAGLLLLFLLWRWMQALPARAQWLLMIAVNLLVPLPVVALSGMEHTLQCLFAFLFFMHLLRYRDGEKGSVLLPLLWIFLLTATRYEGLFVAAAASALLLFRGRFTTAFLVGAAAGLPVLAFGLYSLSKGSYFFPNSLLVKADPVAGGLAGTVQHLLVEKLVVGSNVITFIATQRLLLLLPALLLFFRKDPLLEEKDRMGVLLVTLTLLLHLAFASTGWFYRYEAYGVLLSLVAVVPFLARKSMGSFEWKSLGLALAVLVLLVGFPLLLRSAAAFTKARQACMNIYEQQQQMARFLKERYPSTVFAANDVGAVSLQTTAYAVDLWGLGNIDVARSRKQGRWNAAFLDSLARQKGATLALVYDSWFDTSLLNRWHKVAEWQVQNNVILGDDKVSFYSLDPAQAPTLLQNLKSFEPTLPRGVRVVYTAHPPALPGGKGAQIEQ